MIAFNSQTLIQVDRFVSQPTHAIIINGDVGAGKTAVALSLSSRLFDTPVENLSSNGFFLHLQPVSNTLGIDQIRKVQSFLRLKTTGKANIRRIVVLEDAHLMTQEAQNALLKSLEEPPEDTVIILTAPKTAALRDTIYSRSQEITVHPISEEQAKVIYPEVPQTELNKLYTLSSGLAGLLHSLIYDKEHPLVKEIMFAKELLGMNNYERLATVEQLSKDRVRVGLFLQALRIMSSAALENTARSNSSATSSQWHKRLRIAYDAETHFAANPNLKLLLTDLMLQV